MSTTTTRQPQQLMLLPCIVHSTINQNICKRRIRFAKLISSNIEYMLLLCCSWEWTMIKYELKVILKRKGKSVYGFLAYISKQLDERHKESGNSSSGMLSDLEPMRTSICRLLLCKCLKYKYHIQNSIW